MNIAIVHDYLNQMGGAERVLLTLHEIFPQAPIYTSIYAPRLVDPAFARMDVRTSFMQRLPFVHTHHQAFLPLFPFAFESFDLREYDLVLSMSSAWSKNVVTRPETCHVCYCLTPMRFGWNFQGYAQAGERIAAWQRAALTPIIAALRLWDAVGASRVDYFAAISTTVAQRIRKYYRREAEIIYPPVDTRSFAVEDAAKEPDGGYFLVVSRLIPYKRVDLAILACQRLGMPLKIIGEGRDRPRLEALSRRCRNGASNGHGSMVEFLGAVRDIRPYLRRCRAFLFPGEEDFGIAPVEAMAAGRPVVAYAAGGALDTVVPGVTGVFFRQQTVESLATALEEVSCRTWDRAAIAAHAARFDAAAFKTKLRRFVEAKLDEHRRTTAARPK